MDLFQSTLPVWGATAKYQAMATKAGNFNPRSPCGERPLSYNGKNIVNGISIHAPRVGSDPL